LLLMLPPPIPLGCLTVVSFIMSQQT
jgi:hypothetical protein